MIEILAFLSLRQLDDFSQLIENHRLEWQIVDCLHCLEFGYLDDCFQLKLKQNSNQSSDS